MATAVPKVSLSPATKDWRTLRDELFARIPQLTNRRWTDLNESDLGVGIVEQLIGMQELLLYYLDKQANEVTFVNAVERKNVQNLLKLIGYELRGNTSSTGFVTLSVAPTPIQPKYPISIPAGTVVSGQSESGLNVKFFTVSDVVLNTPKPGFPAQARVAVIQGEVLDQPEVFLSDGTENQRYVLSTKSLDKKLLIVKVGSSKESAIAWTATDNFLSSIQSDQVYIPSINAQGLVFIQFGDGKFGAVPPIGQNIYAYPVISRGATGNLAANVVDRVLSVILDSARIQVTLAATNTEAMTLGADPESLERGKKQGPALFSALYRADTKADYIALVESISGVDKANAWGEYEETHPNFKLQNRVTISFLAMNSSGGIIDPASTTYQADVSSVQRSIFDLLEARKPITTRIVFKKPEWVDILVKVLVAVNRTLYDPDIVASDVKLAIQNFWKYDNVEFGQDARLSQIGSVVAAVNGVSWAQVTLAQFVPGLVPQNVPTYQDIPVSRWQLIRISDFDAFSRPVLGYSGGQPIEHIEISTTVNIDSPVPDPMFNPCALG